MWNKALAMILCLFVVLLPFQVHAGQQDPDNSLEVNGKMMVIGKGERTPFSGILFDIKGATKLKLDTEFAVKKYQLELKYQKTLLTSEFKLKLDLLQSKHDFLKQRTDALLKIKSDEIQRLQELVKKNPNSYSHWWFVGGIIAGCLLSIGVYYAAVKINNE